MKKFFLLLGFFLTLLSATWGQTYFGAETDVLVYLSQKKFTNKNTGLSLKFSEMATTLTTGTQVYYSPEIIVTSTTTAIITYSNVNNPGFSGSLLVKATLDVLIDRKDYSKIYTYDGSANSLPVAIPVVLPKASPHPDYKITKTNDGLYLINKNNIPEFYLATQNLYYNDNSNRLGYEQAFELIRNFKIGDKENWRLPTFTELEIIYSLKSQISPALLREMYWSSTKSENNPGQTVKCIMFGDGDIVEGVKHTTGRVLGVGFENYGFPIAVRDIHPQKKPIDDDIINLSINNSKGLMILQNGFNSGNTHYVNFSNAISYINELNQKIFKGYNDWRLPTIEELRFLYDNAKIVENIDGFDKSRNFWSSTSSRIEDSPAHYNGDIYKPATVKTYYYVKNFTDGVENSNYQGDGLGAYAFSASVFIVREAKSSANLDKYIGTFKSQHPSLDRIEIRKENDSLVLKLFTTATFSEYKSVGLKSDSIYFADNTTIQNMKVFADKGEIRYNYLIIFSPDSPNKNSLILRKPYGQIIRANKEN